VFPRVLRPRGQDWCRVLKCRDDDNKELEWLEVKPRVGTAIFWFNLDSRGAVDMNMLHAGAPVINGTKFGLNIWTRERSWRNRR
jgi:prolyl 4-hydroxylase